MHRTLKRKAIMLFPALLYMVFHSMYCFSAVTPTSAGLLYYDNDSDFLSAFPNLITEDFEESTIGDINFSYIVGPLNSSTANSYFSPGDIADGLTINTVIPISPTPHLVVLGGNFGGLGNTSKAIAVRSNSDELLIEFSNNGVNAVAMDLFFRSSSAGATINIYDSEGTLLETLTKTINTTATFFGLYSLETIKKITVENAAQIEMVDNIRFGEISNQLSFFSERAVFEEAYPGLAKEDFEESTIPTNDVSYLAGPLDKYTDGPGGFIAGEIEEDLHISPKTTLLSSTALQVVGDNYNPSTALGNSSKLVCHGPGGVDLAISFLNGNFTDLVYEMDTYVVGMDLWQFQPFTSPPQEAIVTLYDFFGKLIGGTIVNVRAGQENFFGVASNQVISHMYVQLTGTGAYECVDNIQYGDIPPATLSFHRDKTDFVQTRSNLPVENFSKGSVVDAATQVCNEPINSDSDQAGCFSPDDILPGISFQTEGSLHPACPACMVLYGANLPGFDNTTPLLMTGGGPLEISFSENEVHYVGMKMLMGLISIYGPGDNLLGTLVSYPLTMERKFIGIRSVTPISRLTLQGSPLLEEVMFGPNFPWSMYMPAFEAGGASSR